MTDPIQSGALLQSSAVLSSGVASVDHLTPDALFIYMQTRLDGIDAQANAAFEKQTKLGEIRKQLDRIATATAGLDPLAESTLDHKAIKEIESAIAEIAKLDPNLAQHLRTDMNWTQPASDPSPTTEEIIQYNLTEGNAPGFASPVYLTMKVAKEQTAQIKTATSNVTKQLESSAQLEMIQLQSIMSARQTAIQLCTNLVSALGKGTEAIAGNIGH